MSDWHLMDTDELASTYSDYHKDVHGVRPRWIDHTDRVALLAGLDALDSYMDTLRSTPAGRAFLRSEGWSIPHD